MAPKYSTDLYISRRSPVFSTEAVVASSQPLASEIGLSVIKQGGNAADAGVAIAAALNVTEPCNCGIGGDVFALFYNAKTKKVQALNGSGKSPKSLTLAKARELGLDGPFIPASSVNAATVPGAAAAWCDIHEQFGSGKLSMKEILKATIDLANKGFAVGSQAAAEWVGSEKLLKNAALGGKSDMLLDDDKAPRAGEVFSNPNLAKTFETLAAEGKKGFYEGRIAQAIVEAVQKRGGVMQLEDLGSHESAFVDPISYTYNKAGVTVHECPPAGQGLAALIALGILDVLQEDGVIDLEKTEEGSADWFHPLIEAIRLAFADIHSHVGDPEFSYVPVKELLSKDYLRSRAKLFNKDKAAAQYEQGRPIPSSDTVYFTAADPKGNAISMIMSNFAGFGTGIVPDGCGFTLQNRGSGFFLAEDGPNKLEGGKRPFHTIIPAMATKGDELFASFGVMGGRMQPQGHVQTLLNLLHMSHNPQQALDAPRFCVGGPYPSTTGPLYFNGPVSLEEGVKKETVDALASKGHKVEVVSGFGRILFGKGQQIVTDPLELYRGMVANGDIQSDPEQIRALVGIRKLHEELLDYNPPIRLLTLLEALRPTSELVANATTSAPSPAWPFKRSPMSSVGTGLLPAEEQERQRLLAMSETTKSTELVKALTDKSALEDLDTPRGFLLTGPPGTGKSLLMDIFFKSLPVPYKVRFHYHSFLLSIYSKVHAELEKQRLKNDEEERLMNEMSETGEGGYPWSRREEMKALALSKGWKAVFAGGRSPYDPDLNTREFVLAGVARDLIKEHGWLLAFDEVQLVDIAGAGLINRVLSWYWRLGGVVVGTSNRVPEDLYNAGVQRDSLNPFLRALAARSPVIELLSPNDYRRTQRRRDGLDPSQDREAGDFGTVEAWKRWGTRSKGWFVKADQAQFDKAVQRIVGDAQGSPRDLIVYGRRLSVPWAHEGVARFTFAELCLAPLGPADYITLGSTFHTIILTDVPVLPLSAKNEARRLITLLDALYETKTRILVSAEVEIDSLFFPDAVNSTSHKLESPFTQPSPDDIVTSSGSHHPFSSDRIYEADGALPMASSHTTGSDAAGEIGDSLTQEMLGDVIQDLDAPYRPNVSSYDVSQDTKLYEKDDARVEKAVAPSSVSYNKPRHQKDRADPHPSASTPAFQSLSIFTGEEERFAFKRAVSRVHEMSTPEYLVSSHHTPLDPSFRTWEKKSQSEVSKRLAAKAAEPAKHAVGPKSDLSEEKLSGVLSPSDLRHRYPEGIPSTEKQVTVDRPHEDKPKRGVKYNVLDMDDTRREAPPPVLKNNHVWGVREDWGKAAGPWGKGASVYEQDKSRDK
ncbi:hypothetical protein OIV83_003492 [Microbotryomycetes sp. JL201]|nr:hypothetical protein OIV83_003492 [Microbotryomycetes sp. JL201]